MIPSPLDTTERQQTFYELVKLMYKQMDPGVSEQAACLYWSLATVLAANEMGLPHMGWDLQVQAGTASWVRLAPEDDDGKETTHNAFSYVFEPSIQTKIAVMQNRMPEMHCWAGCPRTGVIIDVTTRFLPDQCRETAGMPWTAPKPPDFVMFQAGEPPPGMFYQPDITATHLAHVYLQRWLDERSAS